MNPLSQHIISTLMNERTYPKLVITAKAINETTEEFAKAIIDSEINFLAQKAAPLFDKNQNIQLSPETLINLFSDIIINKLSFSPSLDLVYILPSFQNYNILTYSLTPFGEVYLRQEAGSISYVTKPVIVREGDTITFETVKNVEYVTHTQQIYQGTTLPPIIAGYCFIGLPNGKELLAKMTFAQFKKLQGKRKNENYGDNTGMTTDEGFFASKLIKHAVKPFRRKALVSALIVDEDEEVVEVKTVEQIENAPEVVSAQTPTLTPPSLF